MPTSDDDKHSPYAPKERRVSEKTRLKQEAQCLRRRIAKLKALSRQRDSVVALRLELENLEQTFHGRV